MQVPENASAFVRFMDGVWDVQSEAAQDGGVVIYQSPHYERYHNALHTIQYAGAKRTGYTHLGGEPAIIFQFADETRVIVANNGASCAVTTKPFKPRAKK